MGNRRKAWSGCVWRGADQVGEKQGPREELDSPRAGGESLEGREQGSWWGVDGAGRVGGDPGAYHGYQREKGSSGDRGEKEENGPGTCSGARASRSR